jgi:hypothetical protein
MPEEDLINFEKNHKHFLDISIKILLDGNKSYCFDLDKVSN